VEYSNEVGRALGWDLATYGWSPRDDATVDIREGYVAGKAHVGNRVKHPDRFERKWLQLRQNAVRRGRVVDEKVTPALIEAIDHAVCPVTLVEMTHSTRADTDWSVDRVNNDGAYADGNLVVMSVRANKAKGSKTYSDVKEIIATGKDEVDGLTWDEWRRLSCLMLGPCNVNENFYGRFPLLTRIPNRIARNAYFQLQHTVLLIPASDSTARNKAIRELSEAHPDKTSSAALLKLAVERPKKILPTFEYKYDAFADADFQGLLARWANTIPFSHHNRYMERLRQMAGGERLSARTVEAWSLTSFGRYSA
jgi:hypothetical protein